VITINLNLLAKDITLEEGLKKSTNIAQVKEIIKLILFRLAKCEEKEVKQILARYNR